MKASIKKCAEAIRGADGHVKTAAKNLGMTFQALYYRIKNNEELQQVMQAATSETFDLAQHAIRKKIEEGDSACIIFTLKCHGKEYGWIERPDNVAIAISTLMDPAVAAAMIER